MNSQRIFVLRALNEEHHQKRDYRRARVDYELPCVGKVKERPGQPPHDNDHQGKHESHGGAGGLRSLERKSFQYLTKITSFVSHHNRLRSPRFKSLPKFPVALPCVGWPRISFVAIKSPARIAVIHSNENDQLTNAVADLPTKTQAR